MAHGHHVEAGQARGVLGGVADRRRGEHERRVGPVVGADPAQPAQHLGDVGAEDAAVVVALVDHDQVERAEEPAPPVVPRQEGAMEHVGVGQDVLAVLARPVALVEGGVAVVGGDPDPEPERRDPGELVLGERLGRADVERGGAALALASAPLEDRGERGQLVGERLAGRRTGGQDDVLAAARGLGRDRLVAPQLVDAAPAERRHDVGVCPRRPGSGAGPRAAAAPGGVAGSRRGPVPGPGGARAAATPERAARSTRPSTDPSTTPATTAV